MFMNPFDGFRDPRDPFGLLQMAAAQAVPDNPIGPPRMVPTTSEPALGFPTSMTPGSDISTAPTTDERRAPISDPVRKIPEVVGAPGSPIDERLIPTAASTAAPPKTLGNIWDQIMAAQKAGTLSPVIAALAKGAGHGTGGAPPVPHTIKFADPRMATPYIPNAGSAEARFTDLQKKWGSFGPRPKKQRQDDPHDREQDTYDFRRLKGRM